MTWQLASRSTVTGTCSPASVKMRVIPTFCAITPERIGVILCCCPAIRLDRSSISPRPEERALACVSKDGQRRDRARGHPSRRPRQERGLLRMRSEGLNSTVRCDGFHGIDPLELDL